MEVKLVTAALALIMAASLQFGYVEGHPGIVDKDSE